MEVAITPAAIFNQVQLVLMRIQQLHDKQDALQAQVSCIHEMLQSSHTGSASSNDRAMVQAGPPGLGAPGLGAPGLGQVPPPPPVPTCRYFGRDWCEAKALIMFLIICLIAIRVLYI